MADLIQQLSTPYGFLSLLVIAGVFLFIGISMLRQTSHDNMKGSILAFYSQDLTAMARLGKLDPVVGRENEIERVIQILSRRTKNNAVLVGNSGVGKTAIVEGLANQIAQGLVPETIKYKRILALDLSGLVAGTKYRGEFEKRLKTILDEVIASKRQIILFIDELQILAEAGEASGAIDAADILKPALARGELQAIGATTEKEYEQYIVNDVTLERRFQPVIVNEPSLVETFEILKGLRPRYEEHHHVRISDESLHAAVDQSTKLMTDRYFPDKAIDAMDEAAAKVRLAAIRSHSPEERPTVTADDVKLVLEEWAHDRECFARDHLKHQGRPSPVAEIQTPQPEAHQA